MTPPQSIPIKPLILLLVLFEHVFGFCDFPDYVQSRGKTAATDGGTFIHIGGSVVRREWRMYVREKSSADILGELRHPSPRQNLSQPGVAGHQPRASDVIVSFIDHIMRLDTSLTYSSSSSFSSISSSSLSSPSSSKLDGSANSISDEEKLRHSASLRPYTRECEEVIQNQPQTGSPEHPQPVAGGHTGDGDTTGRYLATHRYRGDADSRYICMKFIRRSDVVVQLMTSRLSDVRDVRLCDDGELKLDEWPLVDRKNAGNKWRECPLKGGYNVRLYDKRQGRGICDVYEGETRLESSCMPGEGMIFRFRHQRCVPHALNMHVTQAMLCLASWTDADDNYVILRHDSRDDVLWCLRYTSAHDASGSDSYTAFLFRDVRCQRMAVPRDSGASYIRLDMKRDRHFTVSPETSLCADDYEGCSYWTQPCSAPDAGVMRATCARTCGVCDQDLRVGAGCAIPKEFRGNWTESLPVFMISVQEYDDDVMIDLKKLVISRNRAFTCVTWDSSSATDPRKSEDEQRTSPARGGIWEQMFVTTFGDGCRPRYVCAQFRSSSSSSSSVMSYRLSQSEVWPFDGLSISGGQRTVVERGTEGGAEGGGGNQEISCSLFRYKTDDGPVGKRYRSRSFKTLLTAPSSPPGASGVRGIPYRTEVPCRLPRTYSVEQVCPSCSPSGSCTGSISPDGASRFVVHLTSVCPGSSIERTGTYSCLENSFSDNTLTTSSRSSRIRHWLVVSQSVQTNSSSSKLSSSSISSLPLSYSSSSFSTSRYVVLCWVFTSRQSRVPTSSSLTSPLSSTVTIYLIPISDCHDDAYERLTSGSLRPMAIFKELGRHSDGIEEEDDDDYDDDLDPVGSYRDGDVKTGRTQTDLRNGHGSRGSNRNHNKSRKSYGRAGRINNDEDEKDDSDDDDDDIEVDADDGWSIYGGEAIVETVFDEALPYNDNNPGKAGGGGGMGGRREGVRGSILSPQPGTEAKPYGALTTKEESNSKRRVIPPVVGQSRDGIAAASDCLHVGGVTSLVFILMYCCAYMYAV